MPMGNLCVEWGLECLSKLFLDDRTAVAAAGKVAPLDAVVSNCKYRFFKASGKISVLLALVKRTI